MLPKKAYCHTCDAERELEIRVVEQTFPVRGDPVTIEAPVAFCAVCGEEVFDRELDFAALEQAYAEYRRMKGAR
ncbi:MAG: YgiT-type zinc finger protein [Moorellaceae bacterium]